MTGLQHDLIVVETCGESSFNKSISIFHTIWHTHGIAIDLFYHVFLPFIRAISSSLSESLSSLYAGSSLQTKQMV